MYQVLFKPNEGTLLSVFQDIVDSFNKVSQLQGRLKSNTILDPYDSSIIDSLFVNELIISFPKIILLNGNSLFFNEKKNIVEFQYDPAVLTFDVLLLLTYIETYSLWDKRAYCVIKNGNTIVEAFGQKDKFYKKWSQKHLNLYT